MKELKMNDTKIDMLGILKVTRGSRDNNIKVSVHLEKEEMAEYIFRKYAHVSNNNAHITKLRRMTLESRHKLDLVQTISYLE